VRAFFKNLMPEQLAPIKPEIEMVECDACHEEKPETCGESVVVYTHRVEGRAVGVDTEWVCNDCIEGAEEARTERMVEARQQYYYEK